MDNEKMWKVGVSYKETHSYKCKNHTWETADGCLIIYETSTYKKEVVAVYNQWQWVKVS